MIDHTIAAARACGARVVLPGTVYNFGPDAFPVLCETSAQQPLTRKGSCARNWNAGCGRRPTTACAA